MNPIPPKITKYFNSTQCISGQYSITHFQIKNWFFVFGLVLLWAQTCLLFIAFKNLIRTFFNFLFNGKEVAVEKHGIK